MAPIMAGTPWCKNSLACTFCNTRHVADIVNINLFPFALLYPVENTADDVLAGVIRAEGSRIGSNALRNLIGTISFLDNQPHLSGSYPRSGALANG